MKQKLDDALEPVGLHLGGTRAEESLVETAKAKSRVLETIAGNLSKVKKNARDPDPPPPIPARVANGVLDVTR